MNHLYEAKLNQVLQEIKFEFGTGLWVKPDGTVIKLSSDSIHADWAKANNTTLADLLKQGWARVRIVSNDTIGESYDQDQIFNVHRIAKDYNTRNVTFIWYKSDEISKKFEFSVTDETPIVESKK